MLQNSIQEDLKKAQIERNEVTVSTLRLLLSEINNLKIAKGVDLSDEDIIGGIQREVKKRKEAAAGFRYGNREESAKKEEEEEVVLQAYLPDALSNEELTKLVEDSINEVGANSIQDMGKVMGAVMGKVLGRADGGTVSQLVKERLTK